MPAMVKTKKITVQTNLEGGSSDSGSSGGSSFKSSAISTLAAVWQRRDQPASALTTIVVLRDFNAIVERARCCRRDAIVAMRGACDAIVKAGDGAAHEYAGGRTLRDYAVSRVTVAHSDDA